MMLERIRACINDCNQRKAQDIKDNYALRVLVLWVVLAIQVFFPWQAFQPGHWWMLILFHTLIWPHVAYGWARTRYHESINLTIDITFFSVYVGFWGFNPFLASLFLSTSQLPLLSLGGLRLLGRSAFFQLIGLLCGGAIAGFYFQPGLTLLPSLIAMGGFFGFMLGVGRLMHSIHQRLHSVKHSLREQHKELEDMHALATAVNAELHIENIIKRLLATLAPRFPLEAVYFLSYEPEHNRLVMAGVYGEAISYRERSQFENLTFDLTRDANSIFVSGLIQRRAINIPRLTESQVSAGAEIDKKLYDIKPSVSIVYFPLYVEGRVVGGLAFINHVQPCIIEKSDVKRIEDYLVQVGTAIKNANLIRLTEQAKEEALAAKAKAEASEEAKSRFLANMSHEIRTPMTAILGYAEALQEETIEEHERKQFVGIIMASGKHLLSMINNILDFSKIEASKVHVERIGIDVAHMVNDVMDYMRIQACEKNISCKLAVNYPIPSSIINDPTRLKQILFNLASNAIKFTAKGGVEFVVSWPEETQLEFVIKDTGIGMSSDEMAKIFEAFTQADTSTTRLYGGTGLGLAISKSLACLMGGSLDVDSEKNVGSSFRLRIDTGDKIGPLIHSEEAWDSIIKKRYLAPADESVPVLSGKVLIADDNPVNQQIIKRLVERTGVVVDIVDDGEKAFRFAQKNQYDMIFLDVQMPVMDGKTAAKCIKSSGVESPIVAFTANVMTHQLHGYYELGFVDVIEKPINKKKLYALLKQFLAATESPLKNVLVVDDDEVNRLILCRQLSRLRADLSILTASNGEEAILKVQSAAVDLIFMDMEMPVMGGLEAARKLRSAGFLKPIYIVTGNIDVEHKMLCLAAGVTGHLPKPLDKTMVKAVLDRYPV
jgi:signal transduction histidine kinase/CheY-like chemotaxis protein